MTIRVLADFHHAELYESLRILFEERLGYELYRPIGLEWNTEGFWKVFDHPETVTQYLGLHIGEGMSKRVAEHSTFRSNNGRTEESEGIYVIPAAGYFKLHKAITLEKFKSTKFDIVISSMPAHFEMFERLIQQHNPTAKHIFQMGNMWSVPRRAKNILNSTMIQTPSKNAVFYHQEFSTELFKPSNKSNVKSVRNMQHIMHDPKTFVELESKLPEWDFKAFGAGNRDVGVQPGSVIEVFDNAGFIYHVKRGGEGYGYNIHHSFATGTPMITNVNHFNGMTASLLFEHGKNCIDLGRVSQDQAVNMLKDATQNYEEWSKNTFETFKEVVNFEREAEEIKAFVLRTLG